MKDNLKDDLTAIAYNYFPKGIDNLAENEHYMSSPEIKNQTRHCQLLFDKEQNGDFDSFYDSIRVLNTSMNFHNVTLFHWNDRCYNLQLAELVGKKHYSVCLNISTIVPYYLVYVLETTLIDSKNDLDGFGLPKATKPVISTEYKENYKVLMQQMASVAETYFDVKPFPELLLETIIPNITLENIGFGKFNFFNAFFLDDYHIRL